MSYEEYKKLIDELITNPDTAPANVQNILNQLQTDLTTLDSLKAENTGLNEKVKTLQDTNIKLYMSQGSAPVVNENENKEKTEEEVNAENVEAFFNELQGGE